MHFKCHGWVRCSTPRCYISLPHVSSRLDGLRVTNLTQKSSAFEEEPISIKDLGRKLMVLKIKAWMQEFNHSNAITVWNHLQLQYNIFMLVLKKNLNELDLFHPELLEKFRITSFEGMLSNTRSFPQLCQWGKTPQY